MRLPTYSVKLKHIQSSTIVHPLWTQKLRCTSLPLIHMLSPSLRYDRSRSRLLAASPGGTRVGGGGLKKKPEGVRQLGCLSQGHADVQVTGRGGTRRVAGDGGQPGEVEGWRMTDVEGKQKWRRAQTEKSLYKSRESVVCFSLSYRPGYRSSCLPVFPSACSSGCCRSGRF